jgi:hypothetical protein
MEKHSNPKIIINHIKNIKIIKIIKVKKVSSIKKYLKVKKDKGMVKNEYIFFIIF